MNFEQHYVQTENHYYCECDWVLQCGFQYYPFEILTYSVTFKKFKMNFNVTIAMEPPFEMNPFNHMWHILSCSWIFRNLFLEYFKLVEIVVVQVLRNVRWEDIVNILFHEIKNGLNEHFSTMWACFHNLFSFWSTSVMM